VNAALNLGLHKIPVISSVVEKVLDSEKGHCSTELVGQSVQSVQSIQYSQYTRYSQ